MGLLTNFCVYDCLYSAFSPIPDAASALPLRASPLVREHRLYQADWLMRYYGFAADELLVRTDGMLELDTDPKLAWALQHREHFPIDVNRAAREQLCACRDSASLPYARSDAAGSADD